MTRHQMPTRTKRRVIAASVVAVALIGTGVVYGISGLASARNSSSPDSSLCIPEPAPEPSETAPPEESAPPSDTSAPEQPPADAPPAEEPPADAPPAEEPPAEQPPAEQPPAEAPPAEQPEQGENQPAGWKGRDGWQGTGPAAAQPAPGDEAGAPPPTAPAPQPQAEMRQFGKPFCNAELGPDATDFVNIRQVTRANLDPRTSRGGSRGTFVSRCGTNQNNHNNPDNFIVAPGVQNGAKHLHDYVGNLSADANSTNESLQAAGTTCAQGDKSTYYWPVVRVRDNAGNDPVDEVNNHNIGTLLKPRSVTLQFRGNAKAKVVAMPDFLRVITGDAKASINGGANGNAKWGCTGFANRFTTKYPICPRGSRVLRQLDFPSCWDGTNFDSANHRAHIVFPDRSGACPANTKPVPALRMTLTYDVPRGRVFAVEAFPEVRHNPTTDHGDFVNVMPAQLMSRVVNCINSGRNC
jgi:hypothetical protein